MDSADKFAGSAVFVTSYVILHMALIVASIPATELTNILVAATSGLAGYVVSEDRRRRRVEY